MDRQHSSYDPELRTFTDPPREPDLARLQFRRWLSEQEGVTTASDAGEGGVPSRPMPGERDRGDAGDEPPGGEGGAVNRAASATYLEAVVCCHHCGSSSGVLRRNCGTPRAPILFHQHSGGTRIIQRMTDLRCSRCRGPVYADTVELRHVDPPLGVQGEALDELLDVLGAIARADQDDVRRLDDDHVHRADRRDRP
jgi:hypothetical protein